MLQDFLQFIEAQVFIKGTDTLEQFVKLGHLAPSEKIISDVTGGVKLKDNHCDYLQREEQLIW